ncbi:MAG: L-fucose mutarotase [Dyadobacter sp. 50-39]|uniref:L-rhamnose mutarotase n=1 Tax=Dyadobacter sp. 50-39 TaxID=1895756 RepID=UPI000966C8FC|nr:L-rhamnose mutarotase [Dyadobacter sp. 50-39]OJV20598.1 MAG: L-fucose mutarotase [Dyadobacter sp. 50-39]
MKKFCLALDLKDDPGLIEEYEQLHKAENAWPEVTQSIADGGINNMEIYRVGNRLFMIIETGDDFDFENKAKLDAANPKVQQWEQLMWKFQQPLKWSEPGEKWVLMEQIYKMPVTI